MASKRLIWKDEFGDTHSVDEKINGKFVGDKDIRQKLYKYEQAESEGRLIHLPCKIGEKVFVLDDMGNEEYLVASCTISAIRYECKETDSKIIIMTEGFLAPFTNSWVLGKTAFLSKEEAEQALKESEKQ